MPSLRFDGRVIPGLIVLLIMLIATGCGSTAKRGGLARESERVDGSYQYLIGPGDALNIFVWRNPDLSMAKVPVRPDGRISVPLVEDLVASGKTSTELAREIEFRLSTYVKNPLVTVTVTGFVGGYGEQVRVVGAATTPQALPYRRGMTVLDVLIAVGGLNQFAAGNKASIVRRTDGEQQSFRVRLDDLVKAGKIEANVLMKPGDILIIPEAAF